MKFLSKRILIIDDQPENLKTIVDIFETECKSFDIVQAPNGRIALTILEKITPDIIITDWEMPEMDGIEFIKELKKDPRTADIPVIMCTGIMISSENLNTALEAGAIDYIRKPIDKIELLARTKSNLHLAEQYTEIKKVNKIKDTIFSIISHDLRAPVGDIKSFAEMILKNKTRFGKDEFIRFIKAIGEQAGSSFSILENLLLWARSQRNRLTSEKVSQPINNAITCNIELLAGKAKEKGITITNDIPQTHEAHFDLNLISTVVRNLISNAIKFTPSNGKIYISAAKKNDSYVIAVSDTGVGIATDRIESVFNKFTYETTYGTDGEKGSGIGLKLCMDLVEENGGTIWVESEEGKGSSFKFTL